MNARMLAVARRECLSLYATPIGYTVLLLFGLGTTAVFLDGFQPGEPATMRPVFSAAVWMLVFAVPAVSMRLVSEELRTGTFEKLMTWPVTDTQVVLGKWLGAWVALTPLLLPLLMQAWVLERHARPEWGPILTGLIGLALVAGLFLAIGLVTSCLSQNQVVSFLLTVTVIAVPTFVFGLLADAPRASPWLKSTAAYLEVNRQYEAFAKGLLELRGVIYFLTFTAGFLFLAIRALEGRRWR